MSAFSRGEITVRQAIRLTGYHAIHIYSLIRNAKIKARKAKFGEIVVHMIDRDSLLNYCQQQERPVNDSE